jgi:hypothetical protein
MFKIIVVIGISLLFFGASVVSSMDRNLYIVLKRNLGTILPGMNLYLGDLMEQVFMPFIQMELINFVNGKEMISSLVVLGQMMEDISVVCMKMVLYMI